jgi:hypothetical protein
MRRRHPLAHAFAMVAALGAPRAGAAVVQAASVDVKAGNVSYSKTDGQVVKTGQAGVLGIEVSEYLRLDRAIFVGYRQATDNTSKRSYYQAAYAGARYYPLHIGRPVDEVVGTTTVQYDALLKPYFDGAVAVGRALYESVAGGAEELAADVIGGDFGVGLTWHPVGRWVLDSRLQYEIFQSRGGTARSLSLSGTNIYVLVGSGYLF